MNSETDLLAALAECEQAAVDVPAADVAAAVAKAHGVDAEKLLDVWLRKWIACLNAQADLKRERAGDA